MNRVLTIIFTIYGVFGQVTIPDKENPHIDSDCTQCHSSSPATDLNFNKQSCESCHVTQDVELHHKHPVYGIVELGSGINISESFPISGNTLTCQTCHKMTCESNTIDKNLLRKKTYEKESAFCFKCHDQSQYQKVNPHKQYTHNSNIIESTCFECHQNVPKITDDLDIVREEIYQNQSLCIKCHHIPNHELIHMNKEIDSTSRVFNTYQNSISTNERLLPLSPENEIKCYTCHYSHEKGISNDQQVIYEHGKSNSFFLRIPNVKTCMACHEL